jgi:hypothetical protein
MMVYKFDPQWFNGTIFQLDDTGHMAGGWMEFKRENQPIPASYFPRSLVIERAKAPLPDLFHKSRDLIVVSERARAIFEKLAPGQVEFIPVDIKKAPTGWLNPVFDALYSIQEFGRSVKATFAPDQVPFYPVGLEPRPRITLRLNLAHGYYFINVLARAQRLLWLQMPTRPFSRQEDGVQRYGLLQDYNKWKLCKRAPGDPLIWRESWWRNGNSEYLGHTQVLIDDELWRELDTSFPGQLHPLRAGGA